MATLIPSLGSAQFDSRGELRLAERLKDFLEDNATIWHNLPMGPRGRHPDFVIVHPARGLLVLEVKDWRLDTIAVANKVEVELHTANGMVKNSNPFEQARRYTFDLNEQIQRDGRLVHPAGHAYQGKSIVPFGCGVVFPNITRKQFAQTDLHEVFPEDRCMFKDEMSEGADPEAFRERLWRMVATRFGPPLTLPEFDRLRALLFPEIRIRQIGLPLARATTSQADEILAVMDLHQEQVARGLGEGHRIIRGVAGSGKTLILAFRAEYLARASNKPVLILCYANGIAGRLEDVMQERGVEDRVQVRTFHSWCYQMLRTYGIPQPSEAEYPDYNERLASCVRTVDAEVLLGHIPGGQYDAVLIDEAHDFEPEWLSLAVKMVNPNTKSFLIAYDDMQASDMERGSRCGASSSYLRGRLSHLATRLTVASRNLSVRKPHSHTTNVRQPSSLNSLNCRVSRLTFDSNFSFQKATRDLGEYANLQPLWRCQKQPCTNMAERRLGNTKSGFPRMSRL